MKIAGFLIIVTAFFYIYIMISQAEIKKIRSLHKNKGRSQHQCFIIEGIRAVEDILGSSLDVFDVFITKGGDSLTPGYKSFREISEKEMKSISALNSPPGILAVVKIPPPGNINPEQNLILLDGIKDPGNMGTIIRTAHWFGVNQVVCSTDSVDIYNPKVVQATMGSIGYVSMFTDELSDFLDKYSKEYSFAGLMMEGRQLKDVEFSKDSGIALIVGSEAFGIREEVEKRLDVSVTIPAFHSQNKPESLNASIAASIAIYHFYGTE